MSILVVGSVVYDDVETPTIKHKRLLGGAATFFAYAAAFFAPTRLVAVVGSDFEDEHVELMRARGVDLQGLEIARGDTFVYGCRYEDDFNIRTSLYTHLNVFADFHPKLPESYRDSELVFLANIQPDLQHEVLDQVENPRLVAADTMNYWIESAYDSLLRLLLRVDVLVINEEEAKMISGERHLPRAARRLLEMGPQRLVIKRGEYGVVMFSADGVFAAPAYPLEEVFDPTGAGDTFAGGFMGALARGEKLDEAAMRRAVVYGSALASFAVEDYSLSRLIRLTPEEIRERVRGFRNMSVFHDPEID
jgi:sugar/nucleoside kinase (ribokinase family)